MDNNIIKIDEEGLKNDLKGVIRKTIEETLNTMLDEEAAELCHAEKHERTEGRQNYRSGHYQRKLLTSAGEVEPPSSGQNVRFHLLNPGRKGDFYVQKNYRYNTQGFIS